MPSQICGRGSDLGLQENAVVDIHRVAAPDNVAAGPAARPHKRAGRMSRTSQAAGASPRQWPAGGEGHYGLGAVAERNRQREPTTWVHPKFGSGDRGSDERREGQ